MDNQNKNLILATVLSFVVITVWFFLFPPEEQSPAVAEELATEQLADPSAPATGTAATTTVAISEPVQDAPRVPVETPELTGSISLLGGRIDDISLLNYNIDMGSDEIVHLLNPVGGDRDGYYAAFGWSPNAGVDTAGVPGPDTLWSLESGETLTPDSPITLVWDNGAGLTFRNTYSVDDKFMMTIDQTVTNASGTTATITPYGVLRRFTEPDDLKGFFVLHEGLVRMSDSALQELSYKDIRNEETADRIEVLESGWIGYTDHYWLTTIIPDQSQPFTSVSRLQPGEVYEADAFMPSQTLADGTDATVSTRFFVGAKEWETLREYENEQGVTGFINAIDWGWFFFLTKPIFWLLHNINAVIGNMGWSIVALTVVLKALVLPLAYKSYVSMAKMKELQPQMEKLKEEAGDDRAKLQQGMMKLYRDNKVNPASGCMPMLLQIPIFFSLYKVIFVTLELRHAPWIGWIRDLSAPDPSSILNLFGLLPYSTPEPGSLFFILSLGILPIFLGVSMWLQQKLNPAPTDPSQKMIFAWMPWVFMFMLGSFASGLVLYWITNNVITFIQQYAIMRSHGHKPDVLGNITSAFNRNKAKAEE
ncbi:membrane protein insertase YidC [Marivivens niveibacter]|uniref:Membrane protein insertase YidC n=1 Tax=Marivivens niveibacter TaxID=1930667 RepID=A0A251WY11_9RHOB|nr:membrane protein insertase YidC [Marivivens niveibacter]OUD09379.1 membrane protein insertase YidC [Marivivens niveibacter]